MRFAIKKPGAPVYPHPTIECGVHIPTDHVFAEEWLVNPLTAPEHLAITSLLNDGPVPELESFSLLQIGCGGGGNACALAYYRPQGEFFGVDPTTAAIEAARGRAGELALDNLRFTAAPLAEIEQALPADQRFDYILLQELFTWLAPAQRTQLLRLIASRLTPTGVAVIDFDTLPGWRIRESTVLRIAPELRDGDPVPTQIERTREIAARLLRSSHRQGTKSFSDLMAAELEFLLACSAAQVYRYYLNADSSPIKLQDFVPLAAAQGLRFVADATWGRPWSVEPWAVPMELETAITGVALEQMRDNFSFRRNRNLILCRADGAVEPSALPAGCTLASPARAAGPGADGRPTFAVEGGDTLATDEPAIIHLLEQVAAIWPAALPLEELLADSALAATAAPSRDELLGAIGELHGAGFFELRLREPAVAPDGDALHALAQLELRFGPSVTTRWHTRHRLDPDGDAPPSGEAADAAAREALRLRGLIGSRAATTPQK